MGSQSFFQPVGQLLDNPATFQCLSCRFFNPQPDGIKYSQQTSYSRKEFIHGDLNQRIIIPWLASPLNCLLGKPVTQGANYAGKKSLPIRENSCVKEDIDPIKNHS